MFQGDVLRPPRRGIEALVGTVEAAAMCLALGPRPDAPIHEDVARAWRRAERLSAATPEPDERVEVAGVKPVRPEIDRVPAEPGRHGPSANPVTGLQHGDTRASGAAEPGRRDPGGSRTHDRNVDLA